jgi:hypothetical protein
VHLPTNHSQFGETANQNHVEREHNSKQKLLETALVYEAVERLLKGKLAAAGAYAPGEIFDAKHFLANIDSEHSPFELTGSWFSSREEQEGKAN